MEKAIKNCSDESFSENNIRNLLNRITWGFDDTSNCVFFNCSKEELLHKKNQLIIEFSKQGVWNYLICGQFNITDEELNKIMNEASNNNDKNIKKKNNKKRLLEELELLEKKEVYYEKKIKLLDEKILLINEKLNILNDNIKVLELKKLLLE